MFSVVEICVAYGGVYVFHACALLMLLGFVLMSVYVFH